MKNISYKNLNIRIHDTSEAIRGKDIFYKCNRCQSIIASIPKESVDCSCGNIGIDKDMNRLFVKDYSNFLILKRTSKKDEPAN
jgi:coenzyme F420-reducing hydrogenase beta subunit